jgi:hypothetical protein
MSGFRGSDEALEREIAASEKIGRVRVRRVAAELRELDQYLRALRKERARRQALAEEHLTAPAASDESVRA